MKNYYSSIFIYCAFSLFISCKKSDTNPNEDQSKTPDTKEVKIKINKNELTLHYDEQFKFETNDIENTNWEVINDPKSQEWVVGDISESGLFSAKTIGTTKVIASNKESKDSCFVTISPYIADDIVEPHHLNFTTNVTTARIEEEKYRERLKPQDENGVTFFKTQTDGVVTTAFVANSENKTSLEVAGLFYKVGATEKALTDVSKFLEERYRYVGNSQISPIKGNAYIYERGKVLVVLGKISDLGSLDTYGILYFKISDTISDYLQSKSYSELLEYLVSMPEVINIGKSWDNT